MDTLNQGKKMKRTISAIALVSMMSVTMAASAADIAEDGSLSRPTVWAMGLDAGLVRPVGLAATIIGAGLFVVTLPFSALGGNVGESAERLVVDPAKMTFLRCLGCTEGQDNANRSARAAHESTTQ
ncbi:MAG: hypothetical protein NVS3B3_08800 [Aquirhabdus sp.]